MASQSDAAANNGGERRRVLVVDDARTIAEVVSRYLERAGYDTRQAHTGPGAFSSARSWRPDLIVLDVMLPARSRYRETTSAIVGASSTTSTRRRSPSLFAAASLWLAITRM